MVNIRFELPLELFVDLIDTSAVFDGIKASQQIAAQPHDLKSEEVLLVLSEDDVALVLFGVEHPLFPLS